MDRKEYWREYKRKKRAKWISAEGAIEGVPFGKELTLESAKEISASTLAIEGYNFKVPECAKVLSPEVIKGILAVLHSRAAASLCQDDSSARWDRAITYYNWRLSYKPVKLDKPALWF